MSRVTALVPVALFSAVLVVLGPTAPAVAAAPQPRLQVTQAVNPAPYDHAGQVLTWTSVVTNSGTTSLDGLTVTDASTRLTVRSCSPVRPGGILAAGASTTCTATSTTTQDDLDGHKDARDAVTATATTVQGGTTYRATGSATATSSVVTSAGLSLTATAAPTTVSRVGQQVAYTFLARNKGNQTLEDLLVTAPFSGLSALVCAPVALGGALAPGATTTCRATRTFAVGDLRTSARADTARATGHSRTGNTAGAVSLVQVATRALPPVATDDTVNAVTNGPDVFLPGSTNDRPGETGGPAIESSRTVLLATVATTLIEQQGKAGYTANGAWLVLPDGSIRFEARDNFNHDSHPVDKLDYRVYDAAGRSTVGHLAAHLRTPATPGDQRAANGAPVFSTPPNQPITVDVLSRDHPGQNADGTPGSFDRSSVTLLDLYPRHGLAVTYADAKTFSIARVGDYTVEADGQITFSPAQGFFGSPPRLYYQARSIAGSKFFNQVSFYVGETVGGATSARSPAQVVPTPPGPVATDDHAVTTNQIAVVLSGQNNDVSTTSPFDNSKLTFPGDQLPQLPAGSTIVYSDGVTLTVPGQGTYHARWNTNDVAFDPDPGFAGETTPVQYRVADTAGRTARATLTVTVLPGAFARPDTVITRQGRSVRLDVRANDEPGPSLVTGSAAFIDEIQLGDVDLPKGATFSKDRDQLTVPGEGVYTLNPGDLSVAFDPEPQFHGTASRVRLFLEARVPVAFPYPNPGLFSVELSSTLQVTVLAADPAARADTASTTAGHPVVVPVLANDSAGSPVVPLVGTSVRLRLTAGLPSGAVLSGDTKTLVVPGRGVFLVSGTGEITFVPLGTGAGPPLTVGYQVADVNGTTARTSLTVTIGR